MLKYARGGAEPANSASVPVSLIISWINGDNNPIGNMSREQTALERGSQKYQKIQIRDQFSPYNE